ncbi:dipeptidase [Staphylospora marina]|uniref:dipeptidase n=1 Tax=Staphylospora marina TaxID=2490858 RepID=UPI000F5BAEB1|nr:dipeptidase [Staphylospora marina]
MQWMDGHADVLLKMWKMPKQHSFYGPPSGLDVTYGRLREAHVALQAFAVFVPPTVPAAGRLAAALKQIDLFHEKIVAEGNKVFPVMSAEHVKQCTPDRIGALLCLEGADALQGDLSFLRLFHRLGVRQVGITWNHANEAADGIEEARGGGLTNFGRNLVRELKNLGMVADVSHLSVRGFWEVIDEPDLAVVASHSNCKKICPHIRNLDDEQIRALIAKDGLIGITFYPPFVKSESEVFLDDVLRHVEHVLELDGENHLCFGSDFDGIEQKVIGLEHAGRIVALREELLKRYPERLVKKWAWDNAERFYVKNLSKDGSDKNR